MSEEIKCRCDHSGVLPGCLEIVVLLFLFTAWLGKGVVTTWGTLEIDVFPPAIRLVK